MGEKTMTATVTKTRQLCRAVEKELGDATRGIEILENSGLAVVVRRDLLELWTLPGDGSAGFETQVATLATGAQLLEHTTN